MQQLGSPSVPYRIRIAIAFFSHWRLAAVVFASVIVIAIGAAIFSPNQYQCAIKILVKNDRVTPLVGIDEHTTSLVYQDQISEGRINSEIQLLTNADLLREVISLTPALQQEGSTPVPQGKALRRLQK